MVVQSVEEEPGWRCPMAKAAVEGTEDLPLDLEASPSIQMTDAMSVETVDIMQEIVQDIREVEDTGMFWFAYYMLII